MRRLVLAVAVLLAFPAGASAAFHQFLSPSRNLACAFISGRNTPRQVRCDWRGSNDRAVVLRQRGRAHKVHVTDSLLDSHAQVLRYGHSKRFGRLKCTSRRTGMTCRSLRSHHGFTVSMRRQRLF
jgi:hypothetical protein